MADHALEEIATMPLSPQPIDEVDHHYDHYRGDPDPEPEVTLPVARVAPSVRLAGWYPDPRGRYDVRYWDGTRWTFHVGSVNTPQLVATVSEAPVLLPALPDSREATTSPWRSRILIAGLGILAATGWGFGIMKAMAKPAATPTVHAPASATPASVASAATSKP
jgi:hypothetical protein